MNQIPPATGIRALAMKVALQKATELSGPQAYEIWCAMPLVATNGSLKELPAAVVHLAMNFNLFSAAWKVLEDKALVYERLAGKAEAFLIR
jgi:hypothetical protein